MVAAFGRPSDLRQAREAFAIRDARSAISNRLAGALPVFQNSAVVEKYLPLFGNKIETWIFFGSAVSAHRARQI
jgi:hypothetical protein